LANIPVKQVPALEMYLTRSFNITVGGLVFSYGKFGMKTLNMQMGSLKYACKSLDHTAFIYRGYDTYNVGDILGIEHRGRDGVVRIKRAGTTQNIGPKARAAAGWPEAQYIEQVADLLNPGPFRQERATGPQRSGHVALKNNQRKSKNARR
jgi:hypothetical protein